MNNWDLKIFKNLPFTRAQNYLGINLKKRTEFVCSKLQKNKEIKDDPNKWRDILY